MHSKEVKFFQVFTTTVNRSQISLPYTESERGDQGRGGREQRLGRRDRGKKEGRRAGWKRSKEKESRAVI